jgi:hypothetical protein
MRGRTVLCLHCLQRACLAVCSLLCHGSLPPCYRHTSRRAILASLSKASPELHLLPMTQPAPRASPSGRSCTLSHAPLPDPEGDATASFHHRSAPPTFTLLCFALLFCLSVARHSQSATDATSPFTLSNHLAPETATVPLSCPPQTLPRASARPRKRPSCHRQWWDEVERCVVSNCPPLY